MDEKAVAVITTLVVGFLGSTFLGALLNWPDAGAICAIATMGALCFMRSEIKRNRIAFRWRGGTIPQSAWRLPAPFTQGSLWCMVYIYILKMV
ncbi:MAG: hypothetical protein V8T01_02540 [Oscillospiraceae bacterium]